MANFYAIRIHELDSNTLKQTQVLSCRTFGTCDGVESVAEHMLEQWLYMNPGKLGTYSYGTP